MSSPKKKDPTTTNVVLSGSLSHDINMDSFFNMVVVTPIILNDANKKPVLINISMLPRRSKIPYFNAEKIIISARYGGIYKGFRHKSNVKAFGDIDMQYDQKNVHIKISKNNLLVVGAISEEMGEKAFGILIDHFKMLNQHWKYISTITQEIREITLNWVIDNLCQSLPYSDFDSIPEILPEKVDRHLAVLLSLHTTISTSLEFFKYRAEKIFSCTRPVFDESEPLTINNINVKNNVFSYNLGTRINLVTTALQIQENKKYQVAFHNWSGGCVFVVLNVNWEKIDEINSGTSNRNIKNHFKKEYQKLSDVASNPEILKLIQIPENEEIEITYFQLIINVEIYPLKYICYYDNDDNPYGILFYNNDFVYWNNNRVFTLDDSAKDSIFSLYMDEFKQVLEEETQVLEPDLEDEKLFLQLDPDTENKSHRFIIRESGAVTQTSPTSYKEAMLAYKQLCQDLDLQL